MAKSSSPSTSGEVPRVDESKRPFGIRSALGYRFPDIPLDLLPRGHDLQAKCTENELGHLESRPVIRVPEWMLGNNGAEGRCGDLARRKRAVEHRSNAIADEVQAPDVPPSALPCVLDTA